VPFVCSEAIDRYCDIMSGGILPCLYGKINDLDSSCRDSVLVTHLIITKANGQVAAAANSPPGRKTSVLPKLTDVADAELLIPQAHRRRRCGLYRYIQGVVSAGCPRPLKIIL